MTVGSQKLVLSSGVNAQKSGDTAFGVEDLIILDFSVRSSWTVAAVGKAIEKVSSKQDSSPTYYN
jgi:hypothetical protein